MGDRSDVHLAIGGEIHEALLSGLVEAMAKDGLAFGHLASGHLASGPVTIEAFRSAHENRRITSTFYGGEMLGGCLPCVEAYLEEHDIDHVLWQDGHYTYNATIHYRVGGETRDCMLTVENEPAMSFSDIRNFLDNHDEFKENVAKITHIMLTQPQLSPVKIIAGAATEGENQQGAE